MKKIVRDSIMTNKSVRDNKAGKEAAEFVLKLLKKNDYVSKKEFLKINSSYDLSKTIHFLRKRGWKIPKAKKVGDDYFYHLILTPVQERNLPIEIDDEGEVTIITQRELRKEIKKKEERNEESKSSQV